MGSKHNFGHFQLSYAPTDGSIQFTECNFLLVIYIDRTHSCTVYEIIAAKVQNFTFFHTLFVLLVFLYKIWDHRMLPSGSTSAYSYQVAYLFIHWAHSMGP